MNNSQMIYKGYTALISFDDEDSLLYGEVIDLNDMITFFGESVQELRQNFHDSVDTYLLTCEREGIEPDRPYSGRIQLRMKPALHRQAARRAALRGISLNDFLNECVEVGVRQTKNAAVHVFRIDQEAEFRSSKEGEFSVLSELHALIDPLTRVGSPFQGTISSKTTGSGFGLDVDWSVQKGKDMILEGKWEA